MNVKAGKAARAGAKGLDPPAAPVGSRIDSTAIQESPQPGVHPPDPRPVPGESKPIRECTSAHVGARSTIGGPGAPLDATITAVVLSADMGPGIHETVRALRASGYKALSIVIVANTSRPPAANDFDDALLIWPGRNIGTAGRNVAASTCRSDYLLFLDDDSVPRPDMIGLLIETARSHPCAGIIGAQPISPNRRVLAAGHLIEPWTGRVRAEPADFGGERCTHVTFVGSNGMLVRRAAFQDVGGFDESYFIYFEDSDFCARVREAGWEIVSANRAHFVHPESHDPSYLGKMGIPTPRRAFLVSRNRYLFLRRHAPFWARVLLFAIVGPGILLRNVLYSALARRWDVLACCVRGSLAGMRTILRREAHNPMNHPCVRGDHEK